MTEETLYFSQYETALAVIATAMKKSRLRLHSLALNSFIGGLVFTTGGMLHVMIQADCPQLYELNPGLVRLLQGLVYPIGLFYVVILGMELFNANVFYFSAAWCRGAVSLLDLSISWLVSFWCNLIASIFVCYIICTYSEVTRSELYIKGSIQVLMTKAEATFVQSMLKGIAGNFYAALAIYLQLMCKPLHVKYLMMTLPVFSFVAMGFTHSVADMYMLVIGLINHAPISVGTVAWKILLPGAIGNIIGGSFFGVVITWYCHIYMVEMDQEKLSLPKFDVRDEQPDLNADSRVVRQQADEVEIVDNKLGLSIENTEIENELYRSVSRSSQFSRNTRSPRGVFPVYGMGLPLQRERTIALGRGNLEEYGSNDQYSSYSARLHNLSEKDDENDAALAEYVGEQLRKVLTHRRPSQSSRKDLELQMSNRRQSSASIQPRPLTRNSFNFVRGAVPTPTSNALNTNHSKKNVTEEPSLPRTTKLKNEPLPLDSVNSSDSVVNYEPREYIPEEGRDLGEIGPRDVIN